VLIDARDQRHQSNTSVMMTMTTTLAITKDNNPIAIIRAGIRSFSISEGSRSPWAPRCWDAKSVDGEVRRNLLVS